MSTPSQAVVCIHSFASGAAQYQSLAERLGPNFHVEARDLYGHGASPHWSGAHPFTLADEAAPFKALLPERGGAHLVGHSYGAAVALRIAIEHPARVRSLVLYEPAIWGTLAQLLPRAPEALEIVAVRDETIRLIDCDQLEAATETFIDYWAGRGSFAAASESRRARLIETVRSLRAAWIATFDECWPQAVLRSIETPCLLLTGARSTRAAQRACQLLLELLPNASVHEFTAMGHLGPVSHPQLVDAAIKGFLSLHHGEPVRATDHSPELAPEGDRHA